MNIKEKLSFENVTLDRIISNKGIHGCVYEGFYEGQKVAVKKLYNFKKDGELEFLRKFQNNDGVVKLIGYFYDSNLYIVMDFCQGDLGQIGLDREMAIKVSKQLLSAVGYMHEQRYIHGDIKPNNCLLDFSGNCRLTDFGGTLKMDDNKNYIRTSGVFTPGYGAIEVIDQQIYSPASDVFAVGATMYYFLCQEELFIASKKETNPEIRQNILYGIRMKRQITLKISGSPVTGSFIQVPGSRGKQYKRLDTETRVMAVGPIGNLINRMVNNVAKYRPSCKEVMCNSLLCSDEEMNVIEEPDASDNVDVDETNKLDQIKDLIRLLAVVEKENEMLKLNLENQKNEMQKELSVMMKEVEDLKRQNKRLAILNVSSFVCNTCDKSFTLKANLIRHQKCHDKSLEIKCEFSGCDKTFSRRDAMQLHYIVKHAKK